MPACIGILRKFRSAQRPTLLQGCGLALFETLEIGISNLFVICYLVLVILFVQEFYTGLKQYMILIIR